MNRKEIGTYCNDLIPFVENLDEKPQWLRVSAANGLHAAADHINHDKTREFLRRAADTIQGTADSFTMVDDLPRRLSFYGDLLTVI